MKMRHALASLLAGVFSSAAFAAGELLLSPTFTSCGVEWKSDSDVGAVLQYRKSSEGTWRNAPRFPYFAGAKECRGSILDLEESTLYMVRILSSSGSQKASGSFTTWSSDVPVARTVTIDPSQVTRFPINITDKGTTNGWVRYTLRPGTALTNALESALTTIQLQGAECVLLDDMRIVGGGRCCVVLKGTNRCVRIRNCDISGWGRVGVQRFDVAEGGKFYTGTNLETRINFDPAVRIDPGCSEVVVERCYVHDPRGRANSWYYSHPAGPEAVIVQSGIRSTVLRWNDFAGGDEHWFNDAVESGGNFESDGGFCRDADIYGNYMSMCNDDCIELDGGQDNVRCFDNRFENSLCGVSVQGCMKSPSYVLRNAFTGLGEEQNIVRSSVKTSTDAKQPAGVWTYVWDNLFFGAGYGMAFDTTSWYMSVTGNVFCTGQKLVDASNAEKVSAPPSETGPNTTDVPMDTWGIDPSIPKRPLSFVMDCARYPNAKVSGGGVQFSTVTGRFDVGSAVLRFAGTGVVTSHWQVVSSAPTAVSTNGVCVFDLLRDVVFAKDVSSGALPFAKTGPGAMILEGGSSSASFKFGTAQPGTKYRRQTGLNERFALPSDGTAPTAGYGFFSILEGSLVLERGSVLVKQSETPAFIGGWTAGGGGTEGDAALVMNGGTFDMGSTMYIGQYHGFAGVNTQVGRPAKAHLVVNGGTFSAGGGKQCFFGSYGNPESLASGRKFNTDLRIEVNRGGVFAHGNAKGFFVRQWRGQRGTIRVDGGVFSAPTILVGDCASANDDSAALDVEVANGGLFRCSLFTNNVKSVASPPVHVCVTNRGVFLVDDFRNLSGGRLSLFFDGGVLGAANISNGLNTTRRTLVGPNFTSVSVGRGGMTIRAQGKRYDNADITCAIDTPIVSGVADGLDGGVKVNVGAGNRLEFASGCSFTGPLSVSGGGAVRVPAGMSALAGDLSGAGEIELDGTLTVDVPSGETAMLGAVSGSGRIVKTGGGTLRLTGLVEADVLVATNGTVVLEHPTNRISLVRFGRGVVKLAAAQALNMASLEWTDPDASGEGCAYLDLNGFANTTACLNSVQPTEEDGLFWVKNSGAAVQWTVVNTAPANVTNVAWVGLGAGVRLNANKGATGLNNKSVQILRNLTFMDGNNNAFTGATPNLVLEGRARFPNLKQLNFNNGGTTFFNLDVGDAETFPALRRLYVDTHTVTLNSAALSALYRQRRSLCLSCKNGASLTLPENGCLTIATCIDRAVNPSTNFVAGVYGSAEYKGSNARKLSPATATLRVLSSGPGEVELPPDKPFVIWFH